MADVEGGINEIIGMKFTAESWERLTGLKPSEDGVSSRWISKNGRSIEDGWVDDAPDLTLEQVTEFIKAYPTTKAINEYQKGDTGITNNIDKLKERFKKLTGLEATDSNIDTVLSIDPNREPIEATKIQIQNVTRELSKLLGILEGGLKLFEPASQEYSFLNSEEFSENSFFTFSIF